MNNTSKKNKFLHFLVKLSKMRLVIIVSFFVLLCSLFDMTAAVNNNTISNYDMMTSINKSLIPETCASDVKSVSLILFTKDNFPQGEVVNVNNSCERFNHSKKVIFLTHGFSSDPNSFNFSVLAAKLLEKDYTVFSLNWSQAACYNDSIINLLEYPFAAKNTYKVGVLLASIIKSVVRECKVPFENITLLGHSLGAHISSFAAMDLFNSGYGKSPRLIGLDPGAPLFMSKSCGERFCKDYAEHAVVIHVSAVGLQVSMGHLDLWFNNGTIQPGCGPLVNDWNIIDYWNNIDDWNVIKCMHNKAIDYMIVILSSDCVFPAVRVAPKTSGIHSILSSCPCNKDNCTVVDDSAIFDKHSNVTGDYCVSTLSTYPYCKENDFSCKATNSAL